MAGVVTTAVAPAPGAAPSPDGAPVGSAARLRTLAGRFGPVLVVTVASQGVSALALLALPLLGAGMADVYSIGIQTGNGANAGLVLSVVYLLALGRPGFRHWRAWGAAAVGFSLGLAALNARLLAGSGALADQVPAGTVRDVVAVFGVGGALLALGGIRAVTRACQGRPAALAGVTLVPNATMLAAIGLARLGAPSPFADPLAPAVAWVLGAGLVLVGLVVVRPVPRTDGPAPAREPEERSSAGVHAVALVLGAVAGTVLPGLYTVALTQLAPGVTAALFLVSRLGTSVVGLGVNSVLLVRYRWDTGPRPIARAATGLMAAALVGAVTALGMRALGAPATAGHVVVVLAWVAALLAAPLVTREINARRLGSLLLVKVLVDAVLGVVAVLGLWWHPSVTGYFAAFMVSQCVSVLVPAIALRRRGLVRVSAPALVAALLLIGLGW